MSTPSAPSDTFELQTTSSFTQLHYAVTHVFLPVQLPDHNDCTLENDLSLARAVCAVAHAYSAHVSEQVPWHRITKMLDNLQASTQSEQLDNGHVISQLREMRTGEILAFFMRPQNAAVILTKQEDSTLCESFKVSPSSDAVKRTVGSLICSYPWSAVETPNEVFDDGDFHFNLANFLTRPTGINSDLPRPLSTGSQYIVALLTGILRDIVRTADVPRITKRIRDHTGSFDIAGEDVWRRSSLWLLIRVAIQMSLDFSPLGYDSYKRFILFFICALARDANDADLPSDLLHLMSCKILRRLKKLGSSVPDWLSKMALKTCGCLRETLDTRFRQPNDRPSPFQNPSQNELTRDTRLSLLHSREYIRDALANPGHEPVITPFHPSHRRRGTIEDFLSSNGTFLEEAYLADPEVTLYDIEQSVEHGIDNWFAGVTNVPEACTQLEILIHKYIEEAHQSSCQDDTLESVKFLTAIELFVALDKLVVEEIPMLADYSPEIPIAFLERLHLRKTTSLYRLSRAYQYFSARQSRSRPGWSVLSEEFTKDSFPVRYYDQSPDLQHLKALIEKETMQKVSKHVGLEQEGGGASQSPLPSSSVHAKVVVFELQCPACLCIWRSAITQILTIFLSAVSHHTWLERVPECTLLADTPGLEPYFTGRQGPKLSTRVHFAYAFHPKGSRTPFRYVVQQGLGIIDSNWAHHHITCIPPAKPAWNRVLLGMAYGMYTHHRSNDVLAAQANCPSDLPLDEFIAFGHVRSGGSLQWLHILQGLRSRTLNLRYNEAHYLLALAAFQVGPFDLATGTWTWHQALQDVSFCNALLDELESLFVDAGAGSIDGVVMNTISLLLTRVLGSTPSEDVSERAIAILRHVRRKTFQWVKELSYNLTMAPMNKERGHHLLDMAATCRSTFDVDTVFLHKLCHSAEDVDALLSCAFFVYTLRPEFINDEYSKLLLERDRRLSFQLEGILRDVVLADPSDHGVDLAVAKIFTTYHPGTHRWEQLHSPNTRWLTCKTKATVDQPSQMIQMNLLDGELRVDGQPVGGLPRAVRDSRECQEIFRGQGFFIVPSTLPGMDFTTLAMTSKYRVHFSLRDDNLVVRAQCNKMGDILELIPSKKLQEDLPPALVGTGHLHWLNLTTKTIEIRRFEQLWEESSENWRIDCASGEYRAYKGRETLVDIRSPTWAMVSKSFEGFDAAQTKFTENQTRNLLITASSLDSPGCVPAQRLSVALLHYGLSFLVNEMEELESCDFRDMVYDENQCVGALFGLQNMLVLRQKTHIAGTPIPAALIHRRVLIPNGFPDKHDGHRAQIDITKHEADGALYHTYNVDTELGCLIGNGSLESTQYLAYLHIMTSSLMPDPLTGKTGAQAALCLLQSAGCRSIMKLKALGNSSFRNWTEYPQIDAAYSEIQNRYYWNPRVHSDHDAARERAAQRAAHLFPCWNERNERNETSREDSGNHTEQSDYPIVCVPTEPVTPFTLLYGPVSALQYRYDERTLWLPTFEQLLSNRPAPELPSRITLLRVSHSRSLDDIPELNQLFTSLPINKAGPSFQQEYIALLENSAKHARDDSRTIHELTGKDQIDALEKHYTQCRLNYLGALGTLKKSLGPTKPLERALEYFGQWPPITADHLLRCLASTSPMKIPPRWKICLTSLALLILDLQQARRLLRFALDGLKEEFSMELENEVCDGWNAEEYPDWLLIQVQGNFLIRRAQAETAMEMISPQSGTNTVMQVNMGEGKSSVIIPITAAVLADGKQLVRVVVPKTLAVQMFELLVACLGGLANRPIYHLPFSRSPEHDRNGSVISLQIDDLHKLMSRCVAERGIVLLHPEHLVSLKLMSVEQQIPKGNLAANSLPQHPIYKQIMTALSLTSLPEDSVVGKIYRILCQFPHRPSKKGDARAGHRDGHISDVDSVLDADSASENKSKWLMLQKWIHSNARDILDESDEILHARFQLVYTIGLQQHMDGYPGRWTITQQVLRLVKEHIHILSRNHPNSLEYECGTPGSFPHIRIVRASDVGQRIISLIVQDVMEGRLPSFNFQYLSAELQGAIRSFISDEDVLQIPDTAMKVEEYAKGHYQNHVWSGLLLLRGLLACNILLFSLAERRWRVDYGLDLRRSPTLTTLAVPYRAKDMPAPDTQFGHPDITIILTCLSYYYTGLTGEQLKVSFELLLDQDDPSTEYSRWVKEDGGKPLPDSLQRLSEINPRSSEQWDKVIFPLFSRNQVTIDFYLSQVVFPKEAKEFPWKLSASSWDLAEKREKLITGFSGTNDSRWLLPMSITQRDLDHQKGTSARVLAYLLKPQNDSYVVTHESGKRWSTLYFLSKIAAQRPEIRVLLDVGAQILDLSNREVAEAWLDIARDAANAIYFNDDDELMILTRHGATLPMASSPLSQRLDHCVVYLDHAHTRGTDLKFPLGSRAAVTLGPKLTKDSLVQGCMRMRKLRHGHSVMFFAPLEVDRSIRAVATNKDPNAPITTVDILCWAIHETWSDIQQRAPYWAQQGMSHKSRYEAWTRFSNGGLTAEKLADAWLQPDTKSLADLYAPCETKDGSSSLSALDPGIRQRCKTLGILSLPSAQMEEEQEREVNREREREREVERVPPRAQAATHSLHPDVVKFVKTGDIPPLHAGSAFRHIFTTLERTTAASVTREADVWSPSILATVDFCETIKPESTQGTIDQYLRPVQWILTRGQRDRRDQVLVVLSPFEADSLMEDIRTSEYVHLHLYAPRTSRRMKPSDDLKLYTIPPLPSDWTPPWALIDQLNVFAGQLYLRDYTSYLRLCHFLGVPTKESPKSAKPRWNMFKTPGSFEENEIRFSGSPLPSVMALLAIRSRGRPFGETHMGKILQGQPLTEKDFDLTGHDADATAENLNMALDMECDTQDSAGSSVLLRSSKRGLETAEICDVASESSKKRLRAD